jgi:hypothetical protein
LLAIMGILSLAGTRARTHAQECRGNLQLLHNAVTAYGIEHHLARGASVHMTNLYPRYCASAMSGTCPASGAAYPSQFVFGTPPACPSVALYTNHVYAPSASAGL